MVGLVLFQEKIQYPASTDMVAWLPAMAQDVGVVAAGFFEGVGEDG